MSSVTLSASSSAVPYRNKDEGPQPLRRTLTASGADYFAFPAPFTSASISRYTPFVQPNPTTFCV